MNQLVPLQQGELIQPDGSVVPLTWSYAQPPDFLTMGKVRLRAMMALARLHLQLNKVMPDSGHQFNCFGVCKMCGISRAKYQFSSSNPKERTVCFG